MYFHGYTNPKNILYEITRVMCCGASSDEDKSAMTVDDYDKCWELIYPRDLQTKLKDSDGNSTYGKLWSGTSADKKEIMTGLVGDATEPNANAVYIEKLLPQVTDDTAMETVDLYQQLIKHSTQSSSENIVPSEVLLRSHGKIYKKWVYSETALVKAGGATGAPYTNPTDRYIELREPLAKNGNIRVKMKGKKYSLYRVNDPNKVKVIEFYISPGTKSVLLPNSSQVNDPVIVDYERDIEDGEEQEYYLLLKMNNKTQFEDDEANNGRANNYYLTWQIGSTSNEDELATDDTVHPKVGGNYPMYQETKLSWFKTSAEYAKPWLPIEYWMNLSADSVVGVVMGDPGMSATDYISSPFYFGALQQIEGALTTDDKGNFAGFSGSDQNPQSRNAQADKIDPKSDITSRLQSYGDYTGTGATDIILCTSKGGIPYQGNKVGLFGMYEFKEQTFNGQSAFTNKHAVTDIVVANVNENERGILANCIGVPKNGKEHGVELVADRYMADKEQTYIFLHINAPYTPFNTGNDVLIGFAIKTSDD